MSKIIVRFRGKDALERIEADLSWTIQQLRHKIAEQIKVDEKEIVLAKDPKFAQLFNNDAATLASLKFSNGEMIHISYNAQRDLKSPLITAEAKKWTLEGFMKDLERRGLIFTEQKEVHCTGCSLDFVSADSFQAYVQSFAFQRKRIAFLYGTYNDAGGVSVEVIYEPPQETKGEEFEVFDESEEVQKADALAALLGLSRVGWAFSHPKRDYLFSNTEVAATAKYQFQAKQANPLGIAFVTLKLTVNDEGASEFETFQVTDQTLRLHEQNLIAPHNPEDPKTLNTKEKVLRSTKAGKEEANSLPTDVLLTAVPLTSGSSRFNNKFDIENRPERPITTASLKKYLTDGKSQPWVKTLTNFHFLLYISNFLEMKTDMPILCDTVKAGKDAPTADNYRFLINSYAGLD